MNEHEMKIEIMRKYAKKIKDCGDFFIKGEIPSKRIDNALKKFAFGMDRNSIIGFYDITITGNGKQGYIFTDTKVYYLEFLGKPQKLWYDDIKSMKIYRNGKAKSCDHELYFNLVDGSTIIWGSGFINKEPLYDFFMEMISFDQKEQTQHRTVSVNQPTSPSYASTIGGTVVGQVGTANKSYEEEKFHARQGHGFAAERANDFYDKVTGHNAKVVGDNNAKNGADRIVDGVEIQSKYCATGSRCINECFDNDGKGNFRYYSMNGSPMQIEVPSDKYDSAVQAMEEKIRRGQVKGVTDPAKARDIVRKGHFTYAQAKNIAKAGTVESLTYDAATGVVIASSALGVSALISFAVSIWNGEDFEIALKTALVSGLKIGGTAFVTNLLASQLTKGGLNSALVNSSEQIVRLMGPKAYTLFANALRGGTKIYGSAAINSFAKVLRGNVIAGGVSILLLSFFDVTNIVRGRISGKQLFKNFVNTTASVAGGGAGWLGGAALGSAIFPGPGTIIGGLIGALGAGSAASKASNAATSAFIEDDAEEMVRIIEKQFSELAIDYLLSKVEAEKVIDRLQERLDGKTLKDMYASSDRAEFANSMLIPLIERQISLREKVHVPDINQVNKELRNVLEAISDSLIEEEKDVSANPPDVIILPSHY